MLGAMIYLPANALGLTAMSLYSSIRYGAWISPLGHLEWPSSGGIFGAVAAIIAIPFFAFAEELFFRGWLTQTLGQFIRVPLVVATLVAVLFAIYHAQYNVQQKMLILVTSIGLSALCLRDQRLELAVGAHSAMNICVALQLLLFSDSHLPGSVTATTLDWLFLVSLKGVLPLGLMYWLLQITKGWFSPVEIRTGKVAILNQNVPEGDGVKSASTR